MDRQRLGLVALVLGLVLGSIISASPARGLQSVVSWIEPLGSLWINALRMVVVPLVASLLIVAVASMKPGMLRRVGATALAVWVALLLVSGLLGLTLVPALFSGLSIDPASSQALRESAASGARSTVEGLQRMPGLTQWLVELVPTNPFRSAADGAMLPLSVFALAFGLAATRLREDDRELVVRFFNAAAQAMLVIVRWVLRLAPLGVFALSLGVASRAGVAAAGAIAYYLAVTAFTMIVLMAVTFAIASAVGGVAPLELARALLPPQVIGFTARSSLASLPAQAEAAATQLRLPASTVGFVLPLAVASFKPHGPLNWSSLAIFSALLYGVPLGTADVLSVVLFAIVLSFAVPGIPSAGMLLIAPVFASIGIPVEALGVLIAVDAIPDMFKTVANVTGQFSSVVIVSRLTRGRVTAEEGAAAAAEAPQPGSATC